LLELKPGGAEFGRAMRITEGGGIEQLTVDAADDIGEGDVAGRAGEEIAAVLAAEAFDDALGFELDENLDEVIGGDSAFVGELLHADATTGGMTPGKAEDSAGGVVALGGKLHAGG
jgi:hypothetical protein